MDQLLTMRYFQLKDEPLPNDVLGGLSPKVFDDIFGAQMWDEKDSLYRLGPKNSIRIGYVIRLVNYKRVDLNPKKNYSLPQNMIVPLKIGERDKTFLNAIDVMDYKDQSQ